MMLYIAILLLALDSVSVMADVQSDASAQIAATQKKIQDNLQNAQSTLANAPPGSSVAVSCTTDSTGNSNCVKNVSSSSSSAGNSGPAVVVSVAPLPSVASQAGSSDTSSSVVTPSSGAAPSVLLSSCLLTVLFGVLTRYLGIFV
jgi:cobalamin biosynthesis Mg chelatase CobN